MTPLLLADPPGPIAAPSLEYAALAPMIIVFGAAIVGVLVEAFGFEGCCDGGTDAQFMAPGGTWLDISSANLTLPALAAASRQHRSLAEAARSLFGRRTGLRFGPAARPRLARPRPERPSAATATSSST